MPKPEWIPEKEAAQMLGYKRLQTLREKVKAGVIRVAYTAPFGRNYQYNKIDIDRHLLEYSTLTTHDIRKK